MSPFAMVYDRNIPYIYRTSQICIPSLSRTRTHDLHTSAHTGRADTNSPNNNYACGRAVAPQRSARRRCGAWPPVVRHYSRPAYRGPRLGSHTRRKDGQAKREKTETTSAGACRPRPMRLGVGAGDIHTYMHVYMIHVHICISDRPCSLYIQARSAWWGLEQAKMLEGLGSGSTDHAGDEGDTAKDAAKTKMWADVIRSQPASAFSRVQVSDVCVRVCVCACVRV
jgi:hypothetical protein